MKMLQEVSMGSGIIDIFCLFFVFSNFPTVNVCSLGNIEVIEVSKEKHVEGKPLWAAWSLPRL